YLSLKLRGFDSICLQGASDNDIIEFATQTALNDGLEKFANVSIRHSSITDKGLEVFLASNARSLQSFELIGKYTMLAIFLFYSNANHSPCAFSPNTQDATKYQTRACGQVSCLSSSLSPFRIAS